MPWNCALPSKGRSMLPAGRNGECITLHQYHGWYNLSLEIADYWINVRCASHAHAHQLPCGFLWVAVLLDIANICFQFKMRPMAVFQLHKLWTRLVGQVTESLWFSSSLGKGPCCFNGRFWNTFKNQALLLGDFGKQQRYKSGASSCNFRATISQRHHYHQSIIYNQNL